MNMRTRFFTGELDSLTRQHKWRGKGEVQINQSCYNCQGYLNMRMIGSLNGEMDGPKIRK